MATDVATREFSAGTKDLGEKIIGLTLKQAKELSDYLEEVHGIKPAAGGAVVMAAPGEGGGGGGAAAAKEEKTEFDVVLEGFGEGKKLGVIKVIRAVFPFDAALDAMSGGLDASGPGLGIPLLHLAILAIAYGTLARLALRRLA